MLWQVIIPQEDSNQSPTAMTVDADNWYSALKNGLDKHGMRLSPISKLSCSISKSEGFVVEDTASNTVYQLKPTNGQGPANVVSTPPEKEEQAVEAAPKKEVEEPLSEEPKKVEVQEPAPEEPETAEVEEPSSEATLSNEAQKQILEALPSSTEEEPILDAPPSSEAEEPAHLASNSSEAKEPVLEAPPSSEAEEPPQEIDPKSHTVMFSKDEAADDGSGIFYMERLIAVPEDTSKEEAGHLIMQYYEKLKESGSINGDKLFISIQIYDHEFEEHAGKPAVAALTWKGWTPKKPQILFPLSGAEGVTFSKMPPPPSVDEEAPKAKEESEKQAAKISPVEPVIVADPIELNAEVQIGKSVSKDSSPPAEPIELSAEIKNPTPAPEAVKITEVSPKESKQEKKEESLPKSSIGKGIESQGGEDKMVAAFDRMHDIFEVRDHDGAAAFALSLAMELVLSEAGSCMLISPGKYDLYVSAAEGPTAEAIKGSTLSLTKGIVGFAVRTGVAVRVTDAQNDPRFNDEVDKKIGFTTRNLICAPIQHEGRIRGALELVNSAPGFSPKDVDILTYIAGALAEYIDTSLPSRQADFSDREFLEPGRPGAAKAGKKRVTKKTPARTSANAKSSGSGAKSGGSSQKAGSQTAKSSNTKTAKSASGKTTGKDKKGPGSKKKGKKKKNRRK